MKAQTITTFSINELPESAKEKALDNMRNGQLDYDWHEFVYEDAKTIGALMGIDVSKIWFSGFASQGDGACFEGDYTYRRGSVCAVKSHAPLDKDLHAIAENLFSVQRRNFYQLHATIKHRGHYYHSGCTDIAVYRNSDTRQDPSNDAEGEIKDCLRSFMDWIYSALEREHDYQLSDEVMIENCLSNDYQFTENGSFYA